MIRILYLSPGPSPYSEDPRKNMFYHLSKYFCGNVLSPLWGRKNPRSIKKVKEIERAMGNFRYHVTFSTRLPWLIKILWDLFFYLLKGIHLHYFRGRYDAIITYGAFKTGIAGYLLKIFTRTKLIIRFPGNPEKSFIFNQVRPNSLDIFKQKISKMIVNFLIKKADHINLLYPDQINGLKDKEKISIFHDFSSISLFKPTNESDKFILFLGYPWYLKGVDILIKAFKKVSKDFPDYKLKIVGFCPYPERMYFERLAEGNSNIELCNPIPHKKAMELMSRCSLFILPSRTEAMGRVLLEAMASKKPIIASNVDGIPHYIKHGFNGLLFESENVEDLAEKIKIILSNPDYAKKLAENGYNYVHQHLSEERYVECFKKMVDKVLSNKN